MDTRNAKEEILERFGSNILAAHIEFYTENGIEIIHLEFNYTLKEFETFFSKLDWEFDWYNQKIDVFIHGDILMMDGINVYRSTEWDREQEVWEFGWEEEQNVYMAGVSQSHPNIENELSWDWYLDNIYESPELIKNIPITIICQKLKDIGHTSITSVENYYRLLETNSAENLEICYQMLKIKI